MLVDGSEEFLVTQDRQILNVNDFSNACGDCTLFCVHDGQPWYDKPRLFLNEPDFLLADHNAYRIIGDTVYRRHEGRAAQLTRQNGHLLYETDAVQVILSRDFQVRGMTLKAPFEGALSLKDAAEMLVVLDGVTASLPGLVI